MFVVASVGDVAVVVEVVDVVVGVVVRVVGVVVAAVRRPVNYLCLFDEVCLCAYALLWNGPFIDSRAACNLYAYVCVLLRVSSSMLGLVRVSRHMSASFCFPLFMYVEYCFTLIERVSSQCMYMIAPASCFRLSLVANVHSRRAYLGKLFMIYVCVYAHRDLHVNQCVSTYIFLWQRRSPSVCDRMSPASLLMFA